MGGHKSGDGIRPGSFTALLTVKSEQLLCRNDAGTCHSRHVALLKVNHVLLVLKLRMGNLGSCLVMSLTMMSRDNETTLTTVSGSPGGGTSRSTSSK